MPTPGHPGTPRPRAGPPAQLDIMLAAIERWVAQQEQRPTTRNAAAIRLARVRLHLYELRLKAIDTIEATD